MNIMVENKLGRDIQGYYRVKTPRASKSIINAPTTKPIVLHANKVNAVDKEVWEEVINVNNGVNTIAVELQQGNLAVVGGADLSEENKHANNQVHTGYHDFVTLFKICRSNGGKSSPELAPYVDGAGIPTLEMARGNLGSSLNAEQYNGMVDRLKTEIAGGMHKKTIVIPGIDITGIKSTVETTASKEGDKVGTQGRDYSELVTKLEENIKTMFINEKAPKKNIPGVAMLKQYGIEVNREERDVLWAEFLKKEGNENPWQSEGE